MTMRATETGIDWDRIRPEDYDQVAAYVNHAASQPCSGRISGLPSYAYNPDHSNQYHYTTRGGEQRCELLARRALNGPLPRNIQAALQRALPAKRSVIFAEQVRTS